MKKNGIEKKKKDRSSRRVTRSLNQSRSPEESLHSADQPVVPDRVGGSLPETRLLPQSQALLLCLELGPQQPPVETPIETGARGHSKQRDGAGQAQPEQLLVHTEAPERPLLEKYRIKSRKTCCLLVKPFL